MMIIDYGTGSHRVLKRGRDGFFFLFKNKLQAGFMLVT